MKNTASGGTGLSRLEVFFSFKPKNGRRAGNHPRKEDRSIEPGNPPRISKLMASAIRCDGLVRRGEVRDNADLAGLSHVTPTRITQIMNLLNMGQDIQEAILCLPRTIKGRDRLGEKEVRPIAAVLSWRKLRNLDTTTRAQKTFLSHCRAEPRDTRDTHKKDIDNFSITLYHVTMLNQEGEISPKNRTELPACSLKPALEDRSLITSAEAGKLIALFKVLANDTRLRLIHALAGSGELCVTDLAAALGMKPQAVSNQLQRLSDRGILRARRDGNNVHYRIVDPCVLSLLELGLCLIEEAEQRADR